MEDKVNSNVPSRVVSTSSVKQTKERVSLTEETDDQITFQSIAAIKDASLVEKKKLFMIKIQQCCSLFDFNDPSREVAGKEMKRNTLQELIEYVKEGQAVFTEAVYIEVVNMVARNCFRTLPPSQYQIYDPDEDEPVLEPTWLHLELVYEFFMEVLSSPEFKTSTARKHMGEAFLLQLLPLLDSEDVRERLSVKNVVHKLYSVFTCFRYYLRTQLQNILLEYLYETEKFRGISEILEIFASIIQGYVLPLKEEHKTYLIRILMPLHKANGLPFYHSQLVYCIVLFIEKDSSLGTEVIMSLLRYWPKTCTRKEVLFLTELEEILSGLCILQFKDVMEPVFNRIASCLMSQHFQVSEKSLLFAYNSHIMGMVNKNASIIFPILLPCMLEMRKEHWNKHLQPIIDKVVKDFSKMNSRRYSEILKLFKLKDGENNHKEVKEKTKGKAKARIMRRFSFSK